MHEHRYAVIGAGPSGLAAARALQKAGIAFDGYEASRGVGGLWDIDNPRSTMYESAHLISSRTTTEFAEFPMDSDADYPGHRTLMRLLPRLRRPLRPDRAVPLRHEGHRPRAGSTTAAGCCAPTGPGRCTIEQRYDGRDPRERHARRAERARRSAASSPASCCTRARTRARSQLAGKRVLIIGAGNSGCDIAVDAVHHAASVDMSVRRGYYFVPRYLFGRPSDTLNQGKPLPARDQAVHRQAGAAGVHRRPGAVRLPRSPTTRSTSRTRSSTR